MPPQYKSMIGYCPQSAAIYDKLTGKETLKLMAILRGISPFNVNRHVDKWIKLLGTLNVLFMLISFYIWFLINYNFRS